VQHSKMQAPMSLMGQSRRFRPSLDRSALPPVATDMRTPADGGKGRVEDGRGRLGHVATLRFPSPLIEPDVPISGIRLSDWFHRAAHGEKC
jgi:hypothetical protein